MERKLLILFFFIFNVIITVKSKYSTESYCNRHQEYCNSKKNFKCGSKYCSINEKSCQKLLNLETLISSVKNLKTYQTQLQNFHLFLMAIKDCERVILKNEICIREKACHKFQFVSLKTAGLKVPIRVECPCDMNHPYACKNRFCGSRKKICQILETNLESENNSIKVVQCEKGDAYF